ncbi:unnamed protein product, partial [Rangifer tarandus platyrhynchus]
RSPAPSAAAVLGSRTVHPDRTSSANPTPPASIPPPRSCLSAAHTDEPVQLLTTGLRPQLQDRGRRPHPAHGRTRLACETAAQHSRGSGSHVASPDGRLTERHLCQPLPARCRLRLCKTMGVNSLEKLRKTKFHYPLAMNQRTDSRRALSREDPAVWWGQAPCTPSTGPRRQAQPRCLHDLEAGPHLCALHYSAKRWAREATQEDPLEVKAEAAWSRLEPRAPTRRSGQALRPLAAASPPRATLGHLPAASVLTMPHARRQTSRAPARSPDAPSSPVTSCHPASARTQQQGRRLHGPPSPGGDAPAETPLLPYSSATLLGQPGLLPSGPLHRGPSLPQQPTLWGTLQPGRPARGVTASQERAGMGVGWRGEEARYRYMASSSRDKAAGMTPPPQPAQAAREPRVTAQAGPDTTPGAFTGSGHQRVRSQVLPPPPRGQSPQAGVRARRERACMKATAEHSASQTALLNRVTYK